jgi:hypothetical protein
MSCAPKRIRGVYGARKKGRSVTTILIRGEDASACRMVYGLVDPRTPSHTHYVGQTCRGAMARYMGHLSDAAHDSPNARARWVAELRSAGYLPDMVLLERVPEGMDLDLREAWWIDELKARDQAGLNAPLPDRVLKRLISARIVARSLARRPAKHTVAS